MRLTTNDMTRAAVFAALAVVVASIARLNLALVPFSLVPFVAMLAGCVGGPKVGAMSMLAYTGLGLLGVPVFASAPFGGPTYVLKPTFGFVVGFVACAWVAGAICHSTHAGYPGRVRCVAASLSGMALMYIVGVPYLWGILDIYLGRHVGFVDALRVGLVPFVAADAVKATVGGLLAAEVVRRLPAQPKHVEEGGDALA